MSLNRHLKAAPFLFIIAICFQSTLFSQPRDAACVTEIKQSLFSKEGKGISPMTDSTFAFLFSIINDNQTGSVERGEKGYYIGPDDFLTMSYLMRLYWRNNKLSVTQNTLTSRHFNFRYDLLSLSFSKEYIWRQLRFQPEIGFLAKGDFGGEYIQNGFHRMKDLPEVFLPYSSGGMAGLLAADIEHNWQLHIPWNGQLSANLELRVYSDFIPSRICPSVAYQWEMRNNRFQMETLLGWRFFLNEVNDYSEMVSSGILLAISLKTRVFRNNYFDFGFSFFPVQNVENDPLYAMRSHDYLPQIWTVYSWNTFGRSLRDIIDY